MNSIILALIVLFAIYVLLVSYIALKLRLRKLRLGNLDNRANNNGVEQPEELSSGPVSIDLQITNGPQENTKCAKIVVNPLDVKKQYSYAFYLLADDERLHTRWYSDSPNYEFTLPKGNPGTVEVFGFAVDKDANKYTVKKAV